MLSSPKIIFLLAILSAAQGEPISCPPSAASVPSRFQGLFRRPDGSTAGGGIFVGPKSLTVTRPGDRSGSTICYTSGSSVTRYGDFGGSPVVYAALSFAAPLMPGVSSDTICIVVIMASGGQGPPVAFARASSSSSDCTVFSISGTLQSNTVGLSDDPQLNGFLVAVAYYDPPPLCSNFLTYTDNAFPGVPVWARATVAGNTDYGLFSLTTSDNSATVNDPDWTFSTSLVGGTMYFCVSNTAFVVGRPNTTAIATWPFSSTSSQDDAIGTCIYMEVNRNTGDLFVTLARLPAPGGMLDATVCAAAYPQVLTYPYPVGQPLTVSTWYQDAVPTPAPSQAVSSTPVPSGGVGPTRSPWARQGAVTINFKWTLFGIDLATLAARNDRFASLLPLVTALRSDVDVAVHQGTWRMQNSGYRSVQQTRTAVTRISDSLTGESAAVAAYSPLNAGYRRQLQHLSEGDGPAEGDNSLESGAAEAAVAAVLRSLQASPDDAVVLDLSITLNPLYSSDSIDAGSAVVTMDALLQQPMPAVAAALPDLAASLVIGTDFTPPQLSSSYVEGSAALPPAGPNGSPGLSIAAIAGIAGGAALLLLAAVVWCGCKACSGKKRAAPMQMSWHKATTTTTTTTTVGVSNPLSGVQSLRGMATGTPSNTGPHPPYAVVMPPVTYPGSAPAPLVGLYTPTAQSASQPAAGLYTPAAHSDSPSGGALLMPRMAPAAALTGNSTSANKGLAPPIDGYSAAFAASNTAVSAGGDYAPSSATSPYPYPGARMGMSL